MSYTGTSAFGLRIPVVKQGDNLTDMIMSSLNQSYNNNEYHPKENDIIGITESIVARVDGRYVTVNMIVEDLKNKFEKTDRVYVYNPIFSRNRFSIILRAIARCFDTVVIVCDDIDEVGNHKEHPITNVNYLDFYKSICKEENSDFKQISKETFSNYMLDANIIDCTLHPEFVKYKFPAQFHKVTLKDICKNVSDYGLLGSNKVDEETLKLFPDSRNQHFVDELKIHVQQEFGLNNVDVMIYGDGCYKDACSGIWEFADPVVSPAYTSGLEGTPAELKLKYLADNEFKNLKKDELTEAIKNRIMSKNVVQGNMETQGTTPRKYTDLLGSLMDLISGSGDKGTPVVIVQDYFKNYSMD